MDFRLTKEEALFQKMCREFALNEVEPLAAEIDEQERYPEETVQKLMKYGLMGIQFPKEVGGSGGNYVCYSIAIEEMSRVCATTGGIMSAHGTLGAWPIYAFGTEEQKEKWLRPLIEPKEGAKIGAFGLTEPNAGTDSAAQQTIAAKQEDGSYILNGTKVFITGGGRADTYVVFAMTDKTKGNKGISAFIVDKDDPGFSIGKIEHKMGIRGSQTAELIFEDVHLPADRLLGKENGGFKIAMMTLDGGRIGIASQALGIAQGALDKAIQYMRSASSSARRWTSSRACSGWSPICTPRSMRPVCSCAARRSTTTSVCRSPRKRPWPSCSLPRPRWTSPPSACRSTAATATSVSTRWSA